MRTAGLLEIGRGKTRISAEVGSLSTHVKIEKYEQRADHYRNKLFRKNTLRVQIQLVVNTKYKLQHWCGGRAYLSLNAALMLGFIGSRSGCAAT
jgi:hypothetical protein